MKITELKITPTELREFDLPEGFKPEHIEDIVEIFNTPLVGSYNWDYTDADTRIKKLYELGKKLNWMLDTDLIRKRTRRFCEPFTMKELDD